MRRERWVGSGQLETQKDKLLFNIEPFAKLSSEFRRSVEEEAEAYADFLGGASERNISWSRS